MLGDKTLTLLDCMFPGSKLYSVPKYTETNSAETLKLGFHGLEAIEIALESLLPKMKSDDVNSVLKKLRLAEKSSDDFIFWAVVSYFSSDIVASQLSDRFLPLFPNNTVMEDIDYELIEPVLMRKGISS